MFYRPDKKRHSLLRTVFALLLIPGWLTVVTSCNKQEKPTGPREKAIIGVSQSIISLPIIIAQEKGFFSDEGIDVTLKFYPTGKKAMEGMFAGEADIITVTETPIVFNSFMRDDFSVFATFAYSYDDVKVLGRKDKGVDNPTALKGRTIGTVLRTSNHFFAHIYLTEHGLDPSTVIMVDFSPTDLPGALKDGTVDAIVIFEPYAYQATKALPDKVVRLPRSDLYKETFNLTAMRSFAKTHPETLKRTLKAVDKATIFIKQNKRESIAIMCKVLKLEEDLLISLWDDFTFELSLEDSLLIVLEDEARWAMKNRFTDKTKVPNYLGYVYPDAMKAIKPEEVTIIK